MALNEKKIDSDKIKGRNFFIVRMVKNWNKLPRDVVIVPSVGTFKDKALSNLKKLKMSLFIAVGF